jgi:hypothetical protein
MTRTLSSIAAAILAFLFAAPGLAQTGGIGRGIVEIARVYDLDPAIVAAIISVESDFNPRAISRQGARGMMQLMPATARELGVGNIDDPWENIEGGARYFREKLDRFAGDLRLALAAYNAGEAPVRRYGGIPPYPETVGYVNEVLARYRALKTRGLPQAGSPDSSTSVREPAPSSEPTPPTIDRSPGSKPAIVLHVEDVGPSATAMAHLREGARLAREGQPAKAMEHYRRARALAPASPEPHNQGSQGDCRFERVVSPRRTACFSESRGYPSFSTEYPEKSAKAKGNGHGPRLSAGSRSRSWAWWDGMISV